MELGPHSPTYLSTLAFPILALISPNTRVISLDFNACKINLELKYYYSIWYRYKVYYHRFIYLLDTKIATPYMWWLSLLQKYIVPFVVGYSPEFNHRLSLTPISILSVSCIICYNLVILPHTELCCSEVGPTKPRPSDSWI